MQVNVKSARDRIVCFDSRSGRILNEFQLPECLLMIFEVSLIEALGGLNGNGLLDRDFESVRRRWQGGSDIEPAVYGATQ